MNKLAFVIGNGSSRLNFDLKSLNDYGSTYGCNAIHRDFYPNHLIVTQRKHLQEAMSWNLQSRLNLYTTFNFAQMMQDPNIEIVPNFPFDTTNTVHDLEENFKTGSWALLTAAERHEIVVCIGYDYDNGNIYDNTDNYWRNPTTDYAPHMQQTLKILDHYSNTKFIFVQDNIEKVKAFDQKENVTFNTFDEVTLLLT